MANVWRSYNNTPGHLRVHQFVILIHSQPPRDSRTHTHIIIYNNKSELFNGYSSATYKQHQPPASALFEAVQCLRAKLPRQSNNNKTATNEHEQNEEEKKGATPSETAQHGNNEEDRHRRDARKMLYAPKKCSFIYVLQFAMTYGSGQPVCVYVLPAYCAYSCCCPVINRSTGFDCRLLCLSFVVRALVTLHRFRVDHFLPHLVHALHMHAHTASSHSQLVFKFFRLTGCR